MTDPNILFKEQMAKARRAQILDAAATVFAEKGFHRATTKEIATVAGVSPGTIYNYFSSKRELLFAMLSSIAVEPLDEALSSPLAEDERGFIVAILNQHFDSIFRNIDIFRVVLAEVWTDEEFREQYFDQVVFRITSLVETYIEAGIEAGVLRPVNPSVIAQAVFGAFIAFVFPKMGHKDPLAGLTTEELVSELADFFLDGVRVHPGREGVR